MINRRRLLVSTGAAALLMPLRGIARPSRLLRFGNLFWGSRRSFENSGRYAALALGLRELGYVEGTAFVLENRFARGDTASLAGLAAELVQRKVDLILSTGTPAHLAAQRATTTIPIVVMADADPVGNGLAASLARPGGNITGMSTSAIELVQKLLELLVVALPGLARAAVLSNPTNRSHPPMLSHLESAARLGGKQMIRVGAGTDAEIERGFATMARERADALIVLLDGFLTQQSQQKIADLALRHRLPSIFPTSGYAGAGGLMSYGANIVDNYRRAGVFIDKILKGANPGLLPFEQATRFYLEINRRTATALGVRLPQELMLRADKVIE